MKKLEMIIKPEKLDDVKKILDDSKANGVMVTNIMGYGAQKGFKRIYRGNEYFVNLLPKVKVETVDADDVADAVRVRPGERGESALSKELRLFCEKFINV